ncbi:MAG: 1-acyl-sn-glycerol-3-phosphate acyltransferase [Candidatus Omnitrophica bacterium]|nr:1-acyl-sn-glycerol-3-phosphate acyltransferase [Candidatus Omnitrophota bacterium]
MKKILLYLKNFVLFLNRKRVYLRAWAFPITKFFVKANFKIVFKGLENIPDTSSALIVSNHSSYLDVLLIGTAFYSNLANVLWVISKENYRIWYLKWFYALYPVIVVNGTVEKVKKALSEGCWIVIFPEGAARWYSKKHPQNKKPGTGTAAIALSTGVTIVPVNIHGAGNVLSPHSFELHTAHTITLTVGKPFSFEAVHQEKIDETLLANTTEELVRRITELNQ